MIPQLSADAKRTAEVERLLHRCGYPPLRNIEALARGDEIVLRGSVPTYYMKQVAQEMVLSLPGTDRVTNELVVTRPPLPASRR